MTVADAIKHVEFGSGAWNVSEKIIFFASCMHARPWLSASISWKALAAAMKEMAAYFRLTFKAEYKCRNERVCKDFIKSVKDKKVKVPMRSLGLYLAIRRIFWAITPAESWGLGQSSISLCCKGGITWCRLIR